MNWGIISGGPIDFYTWNSLYPYNYCSNYGGQYQYNLMPPYFTMEQAFELQNLFNPFYQFSQLMNSYYRNLNPYPDMQQIMLKQAAYTDGYSIGENIGNNVMAQNLKERISGLKSQLEQALTSDKLTPEQKDVLKNLKQEVENLENNFNRVIELQKHGATPQQIKAGLLQISEKCNELEGKIQAKAKEIKDKLQTQLPGTVNNPNPFSEEVNQDRAEDIAVPNEDHSIYSSLDIVPFNEDMVAADVDDENIRKIVNTIYQKVDGIGSGNIRKYLKENINKDNVVEVMLQWNKHYAEIYEKDDPLGLPETLMDERFMTGDKICTVILEALEQRLKDYQGVDAEVYNKASTQLAIARREHDSWWSNEDKMAKALNKAHKCITILMFTKESAQQKV